MGTSEIRLAWNVENKYGVDKSNWWHFDDHKIQYSLSSYKIYVHICCNESKVK